jgi:tripartite-type tricarboxylate transporter receptor subunit TctC
VPYKGGAPAINDLIAGRVQLMFESLNSISSFAKSGQVRPIAVTADHRSPAFPDVPTVAESGVPGYAAPSWSGVVGPTGLPKPITDKLNAASNKAIQSEMFKSRIEQIGDDVAGGTPDEFAAFIASESKKWGEVIERAGIRIE